MIHAGAACGEATLGWHSRSMDTLHRVAHDDEQAGPIVLSELLECPHDPCVNPLFVWPPQTHHQDAAMRLVAMLGETLVRGDQQSAAQSEQKAKSSSSNIPCRSVPRR